MNIKGYLTVILKGIESLRAQNALSMLIFMIDIARNYFAVKHNGVALVTSQPLVKIILLLDSGSPHGLLDRQV